MSDISRRSLKILAGLVSAAGMAGCYVPNGGWTLRSGFDCRTHHKPACFLELVDTRWDEWNRVAQINAMQQACPPEWSPAMPGPVGPATLPPADSAGTTVPAPEPDPAGAEPEQLPPVPEPRPTARTDQTAARPVGAWLFRK